VRWSRKVENMHITVKFLGGVQEDRLTVFGADLQAALKAFPAFEIAVRGMGAFPSLGRANVIWAGIEDPSGGLKRAAAVVEGVAARTRIGQPETRPFRGHVTVGRAKAPVDARAPLSSLGQHLFGVATVDALHVYESQLGGGADDQMRKPWEGSRSLPRGTPLGGAQLRPRAAGSTYVLRHRAAFAFN